jgi:hypothetical protein
MNRNNQILYKEVQRLPRWTLIFFISPALLFWGIAYVQIVAGKTVGNNPMSGTGVIIMALLFGLLMPAMFIFSKVKIIVTKQQIIISLLLPIFRMIIQFEKIEGIKQIGIKPIQEFGGWGIRFNGKKWALILEGNEGIELQLNNAKPFVISTKNGDKLFNAVKENLKTS